ncbi:hypothetical protein [Paractinoplanes toevensis]|uniref:Uncharacterized protein n=1 Tax=Paractinoplanes toevensis TaxID=571911 RepID=A0A919T6N8_9ACTN|nr:hypothetical protein [Actinoplanes toevensis]GIM88855.1 hypothetical protein Ato02nite_006480 [Actinoplanes toevensis]
MITLPVLTTVPAHPFEPAVHVTASGSVPDPRCGYLHKVDGEIGVFCAEFSDHRVHNGQDVQVRVHDWDDETEEMNR